MESKPNCHQQTFQEAYAVGELGLLIHASKDALKGLQSQSELAEKPGNHAVIV